MFISSVAAKRLGEFSSCPIKPHNTLDSSFAKANSHALRLGAGRHGPSWSCLAAEPLIDSEADHRNATARKQGTDS